MGPHGVISGKLGPTVLVYRISLRGQNKSSLQYDPLRVWHSGTTSSGGGGDNKALIGGLTKGLPFCSQDLYAGMGASFWNRQTIGACPWFPWGKWAKVFGPRPIFWVHANI